MCFEAVRRAHRPSSTSCVDTRALHIVFRSYLSLHASLMHTKKKTSIYPNATRRIADTVGLRRPFVHCLLTMLFSPGCLSLVYGAVQALRACTHPPKYMPHRRPCCASGMQARNTWVASQPHHARRLHCAASHSPALCSRLLTDLLTHTY